MAAVSPTKSKAPTIRDVAAVAGVSIATVSKYVNGAQHFSEAVEDRIREAIKQLQYQTTGPRRTAVTERTKAIGVIAFNIASAPFSIILRGINGIAVQDGYSLTFL